MNIDSLKSVEEFNKLDRQSKILLIKSYCQNQKLPIPFISQFAKFLNNEYCDTHSILYNGSKPIEVKKKVKWKPKKIKREKKYVQGYKTDWYENPGASKTKNSFYLSKKWNEIRRKVLKHYGCVCMRCKANNEIMHVDHIKPRSKFPGLQFTLNNLQVLCKPCNELKSNIDFTDYRPLKNRLN